MRTSHFRHHPSIAYQRIDLLLHLLLRVGGEARQRLARAESASAAWGPPEAADQRDTAVARDREEAAADARRQPADAVARPAVVVADGGPPELHVVLERDAIPPTRNGCSTLVFALP